MGFPIPEFLRKLITAEETEIEDNPDESISREELQRLPVYQTLRDSVRGGMSLDQLIDAFAAMSRLPLSCQEDDLLFETGTYDFTGKKQFYFSLVRQFQLPGQEEFVQLHLDIRYAPSPATKHLQCTEWGSLHEGDFFEMVRSGEAYLAVRSMTADRVDVYIEET